jgi:hypothetical protein
MCGCLSFGGVLEESLGWLGGSGSERRSELAIGGVNGTGGAQVWSWCGAREGRKWLSFMGGLAPSL